MAKAPVIAALPAFAYPASLALEESAYYINDLSNVEESYREIAEHIRTAAQEHHQTSLTLRASNGVINRQSDEWVEIRSGLLAAGYSIGTNNRTQTAEISW